MWVFVWDINATLLPTIPCDPPFSVEYDLRLWSFGAAGKVSRRQSHVKTGRHWVGSHRSLSSSMGCVGGGRWGDEAVWQIGLLWRPHTHCPLAEQPWTVTWPLSGPRRLRAMTVNSQTGCEDSRDWILRSRLQLLQCYQRNLPPHLPCLVPKHTLSLLSLTVSQHMKWRVVYIVHRQ